MPEKDELERTIEFALKGAPQLKPEEKRKWLGEFRERVILGLTPSQVLKTEAFSIVKKALEDREAEMLIVNHNIPMEITSRYMKLASEINKEFKSVATEAKEAMGLVVASRRAVDRENVLVEIPQLPEKFRNIKHKDLCSQCYEELTRINPEVVKEFRRLTFIDKMAGLYCGACKKNIDSRPLV